MLPSRVHGGAYSPMLAELGLIRAELCDFSVNTNPYGPCAAVVEAVRTASFADYPDPQAEGFKQLLSQAEGIAADRLVIGNGAADLLWTLARVLIRAGDGVVVVEPTFCEFRDAAAAAGAVIHSHRLAQENHFQLEAASLYAMLQQCGAKYVYLCTPNSPSGYYTPHGLIVELAEALPAVTWILDEAFLSLSYHFHAAQLPLPANVIRVRSFTKEHSIAGLRIGHLITTPDIATALEAKRASWTINSLALAAAAAGLAAGDFVAASRRQMLADAAALRELLIELGLAPVPSTTIFQLVALEGIAKPAAALLRHRILVRDCSSYALPQYIRLAARPHPDQQRLKVALQEILQHD